MGFKIATWNVNSLRVRLPHVLTWLHDVKPDLLALQETKVEDADFPFDALHQAGYIAISSGQKSYNGVAILWREQALEITTALPGFDDPQKRVLGITIGNIRVLNLYVPNGEDLTSEKFIYKLNWLKYLQNYVRDELKKYPKLIVLGDFNIAPAELDVHDPKPWEHHIHFTQPERNAFAEILKTGLHDCFRQLNPTEKAYTWWDYRLYAFKRNLGLRIDHILASETLCASCHRCYIDTAPRSWERPSDHAPMIAEFEQNFPF